MKQMQDDFEGWYLSEGISLGIGRENCSRIFGQLTELGSRNSKLHENQKAVALTRVCLWRLREERRAIEDALGKDAVPAYLHRCIDCLSVFETQKEDE